MLLIITTLGLAQAGERPRDHSVIPSGAHRFELEGIDAPAPAAGVRLGTQWSQPSPVRLTANTVITASGLVLTLRTVRSIQGGGVQGDLVPGQAFLTGLGGSALLLGGGAMWLTTDFSVDRSGLQQGVAIRGVW
jgi:hypothetical protein